MLRHTLTRTVRRSISEEVMSHFKNPKNIGTLPKKNPRVGTGIGGSISCGDMLQIQIFVDEKSNKITDTKIKVFGCASAVASSSHASDLLKGKTLDEALQVTNKQLQQDLKLAPVKAHCSMLAEDTIRLAIADYKKKNNIV